MSVGITEWGLYELADALCEKHWSVPYTGRIELVNRNWKYKQASLITTLHYPEGGYGKRREVDPVIRMSSKVSAKLSEDELKGVLLHELVHWRLWSLNKPNSDTDKEFVEECERVGAPYSGTKVAQKAVAIHKRKGFE